MHKAALNNKLKPNFYLYLRRSESKLDLKIKNKIMVAAQAPAIRSLTRQTRIIKILVYTLKI